MVVRSKRTVRENPRSKSHRDDATAATTSKGSNGKKKKKLGTTRSVSSKSIKTKSTKSARTKATSTTSKSPASKSKKQMPKIKSSGAPSRLAGAPPRLSTPKGKVKKGGMVSKPPLPPKQSRYPKPNLQISTSVSSEADMSANPLSPSTKASAPNRFPSTPNRAEKKASAKGFHETFGPRPTPNPNSGGGNSSVVASIAESGIADSESFDHTQYSFVSENGTVFTIQDEVTFAMFLTDVKGFLVDKTGKMIPTGPEMVEMVEKTKGIVPESVKAKLNHTARVLDPRDISGRELLASAKDISIATKDAVVEETVGCATWSFTSILAAVGFVTAAATAKNEDAKIAIVEEMPEDTKEVVTHVVKENPEAPWDVEEDLPVIAPMVHQDPMKATYDPFKMPDEGENEPTDENQGEELPTKEEEEAPAVYENYNEDEELDQVSVELSLNAKARRLLAAANENHLRNRNVPEELNNSASVTSNGMSAMTEESNIDMKEALRQIKDLNAEIERLQKKGSQEDVAHAEVLKQRSKALCRSMAMASTLAATRTGSIKKAAIQTTKAVGQASSSIAKSSKKGIGSALISTSKAMGSLGEKLAKSKGDRSRKDDATHTTGDNSTLSSHSRSRSSQSDHSAGSKEPSQGLVLVSAGSRMSYASCRPPIAPREI